MLCCVSSNLALLAGILHHATLLLFHFHTMLVILRYIYIYIYRLFTAFHVIVFCSSTGAQKNSPHVVQLRPPSAMRCMIGSMPSWEMLSLAPSAELFTRSRPKEVHGERLRGIRNCRICSENSSPRNDVWR